MFDHDDILPSALLGLERRHEKRFSIQPDVLDLLPDQKVDLTTLKNKTVVQSQAPVKGHRSDMRVQLSQLRQTFIDRSELELLHALVIAYLRRCTPITKRAWHLFRRMWKEEGEFLLERLPARWIISALQTFYDHSDDPGERIAGGMGFVYGNLIKVYETEYNARKGRRSPVLTGYRNKSVPGLYGFRPGDDVLLNINVLVLDAGFNGGLASGPLFRLLDDVAKGNTIFQRTDALENADGFRDHPSFTRSFEPRRPLQGRSDKDV